MLCFINLKYHDYVFNNKKSSSSVKNGMIRHFSEEDRPWQLSTWEDVQYHYSPGNEN